MMTTNETIPHVMANVMTGERHTIQLTPRDGLTVAEVEAFLAERKAAGLHGNQILRVRDRHLWLVRPP
jgi:hypothetical protein